MKTIFSMNMRIVTSNWLYLLLNVNLRPFIDSSAAIMWHEDYFLKIVVAEHKNINQKRKKIKQCPISNLGTI